MRQLPLFHVEEQDVVVIEPCTQEAGALMIDFNLFQYLEKKGISSISKIDFKILIEHTRSSIKAASQVQASEQLGICKIMCPKWEIIIARTGRIIIRRIKTQEIMNQAVNFTFDLLDGCLT